jgi:hypothetical protein
MPVRKWIKIMFLVSSVIMGISHAEVPNLISYQGILTDNGGNPVPDAVSYPITFTIYDDSLLSETHLLWTETQIIAIKNGMFGTMLGCVTPLNPLSFDKQYYLGVTRNGTELKPRLKLLSTPYSKRAAVADSASKADTAKYAKTAGVALTLHGSVIAPKSIDSSKIVGKSIRNVEIADATILRENVTEQFKAPFADSSDFSKIADSTKKIGINTVVNAHISSSAGIDGSKINPDFKDQSISTTGNAIASAFYSRNGIIKSTSLAGDSIYFTLASKGVYLFKASWNGYTNEATKAWFVLCPNNLTNVQYVGAPTIINIGNTPTYNPGGLELRSGPDGDKISLKATPVDIRTSCSWSYIRLDGN